jgi:polysaccharide biosynthesis transport protein
MNRTFEPPANSPRLTDGVPTVPAASRGFNQEQAMFRLDLLRSLRMHRRLAMGFALAGVILAVIYVAGYWSVYTAQSLVYIQPTPSAVLEQAPMHWPYNYDPATYDSYIQQQMLSMTRPDVLAGAVKKLDPGVWQQGDESVESAADRLKGSVEVARVGTSYQVAITAHARNADTAAAIANAVAESYIENTSHEQKATDAGRLTMLQEERERIKKELDDDRTEQAQLNAQLGVAAIGPEAPQHYDTDIAQIHEELVKARSDHDEYAARLTSISSSNGLSSTALDTEAEQSIATDPGLSSLKQALLTRKAALVSQMANLTPSHPLYKQDQAELAKIDASLESSTQEVRANAAMRIEEQLRTDLDRTAGLEARLNAQLAQMTRAAAGATPKLQRSSDLASDISRLQTRFNTVDEQLQNQTLEDSAPGMAHMAEAAVPPTFPSVAGVIRNSLLLLFGFIGLGLTAAVVAHKMDPRIYVASDVEQLLGYAPMAQLPDFDEVTDEAAEEHLLRLATGIEFACKEGQLSRCVFTGAGPGVGVTTIAKRVREMLGVLGKETMLVDAAGPVPQEHRTGTELQRSTRATSLMQQTSEATASAPEGLMLTDTAPLTVSAEAEYMARRADCTILVMESGVTTRAQLRAAASSLQRLNAAAVGFVLNRVSLANADHSFRQSVSEVERHIRVQGRTAARTVAQTSRTAPETPLSSPVREIPELAQKSSAPAMFAAPATPPARRAAPEWAAVEQAAVAPKPLSESAPIVIAENREAQQLPHPAAFAPAALREPSYLRALRDIDPASLWFGRSESQPEHKPVAVPIIRGIPREVEPVSMPAEKAATAPPAKPVAEAVSKPAPKPIAEPKSQAESRRVTPPDQQSLEGPWWLTQEPTSADHAMTHVHEPRVGTWHSVAAHREQSPAEADVREQEEADDEMPTHLSGLKGVLFSMGIRDLRPWKAAEQNINKNGSGNGNSAHADTPSADPGQTIVAKAFVPQPEQEPAEAKAEKPPSLSVVPRWVTAEPEFLPPPVEVSNKGKESRWNRKGYDTDDIDGIQILPAKRGQYKR